MDQTVFGAAAETRDFRTSEALTEIFRE